MIYLDSAATTLQKPNQVSRAVTHALNRYASPGRGGYPAAMDAAKTIYACRALAADLFDAATPEQVVFTSSATMALNTAIRSLARPGMTVLMSGYEHNAVTRCVNSIPDVKILIAKSPLFQPKTLLESFRVQLPQAELVICNHVSNVFGYCLPVEELAALCRAHQVPLIVDASQSAGCLPVTLKGWGAAFVAMPGHKGLYGPQGTGLLLCGGHTVPNPLLFGGTGSQSLEQTMPDSLPDRLEAGTVNVPGIAGLLEGLRFVQRTGPVRILSHEQRLLRHLTERLKTIHGIELFLSEEPTFQNGVLSFRIPGTDCEAIGQQLGNAGVAVRTGLHCAPLAHRTAGTLSTGTIRVSVSTFNRDWEMERFSRILQTLA